MKEEIASIEKSQIQELKESLKIKRPITIKWVFKTKIKPSNEVERYKTRLVAKEQKLGVDFNEVFLKVARIKTMRLVTTLATQLDVDKGRSFTNQIPFE